MVPNPVNHLRYGNKMPLSAFESAYQAIQLETLSTPSLGDLSLDPFHVIFPTDKMIMSVMSMEETPCVLPNTSTKEERLLYLMQIDEICHDSTLVIEAQKKHIKAQYDRHVKPRVFFEGIC
jgi:hypothetical protein